jgi:actin-related protein
MLYLYSKGSLCPMQFEGWILLDGAVTTHRHSSRLIHFCRDVTDHLQLLLRKSGHNLHTTAEREVVRTIKEKCCYIASNPAKEEKEAAGRTEEFRLPDGSAVQLGNERFKAPEILFNPEQVGLEYAGCIKSWSIRLIGWIWTFERACSQTSC